MESSDNDEPFLALDSMLEVSLVEGPTTECTNTNGNNQLPSTYNDNGFPDTNPNVQNSNHKNKQIFQTNALQRNMDEEEEIFYLDLFEDLTKIRNLRLHCTKCDAHLGCYEESKLYKHLHLGVLLCQECFNFYSSGEFAVGDDGSEIYCRWCGEGGTVICCSNCPNVFCKKCISRNFSKNVMREIVASKEWLCFLCNFRSLWEHRAVCRAAMTYAAIDTGLKQELANIFPRPGDDAKYCCDIDSVTPRLKLRPLRSSMPSHVKFAKFLNNENHKACLVEKIPTTTVSEATSSSPNVTISECMPSGKQVQEILNITKKLYPKKNLSVGVPWPVHVSLENQKFIKPGNIYQIQSSNVNGLPHSSGVDNSLISSPSVSVRSKNNVTNTVLNTNSPVPFMRLPFVRGQYAIITNNKPVYSLQNQVPRQTSQNLVPLQSLQSPAPIQTLQSPVPLQTLQSPVPLQTLQSPVPLQTLQSPVPLQTLQSPVLLQTLQSPVPLQTLQNPGSCQNKKRVRPTVISQYTNASVNFCKPNNSATLLNSKDKQIPSKNHILSPVADDDDDCQIISTTDLNTNLGIKHVDHTDFSASSIINRNNDYISRIRVRTPAMLQSMVINESHTKKCSSLEHSSPSNNLFNSPEQKSQLLKAVLSDHMYVRTEKNPENGSSYNDTGTPLQLNVEQNNTEIMNNRIDSSTDSLDNAADSNSFETCNQSNNISSQPKSPNFKNCLPEITNLAKFMLSRALLLQEEINKMAYVDKSEFYFKNVPLLLESCKAGITKIEVNYIRERNKQLKNSGEPKEILLVRDDDVVSIQPLCAEGNEQPLCAESNEQPFSEKNVSIQNVSKKQIDSEFSEIEINNSSPINVDIQSNCIKRKLFDSDVLSNSKKQKVDSVSDLVVVLERLPKNVLKISESINIEKEDEDKSKINPNSETSLSKDNCIRPCYVRLVRINEGSIINNAK